MTDVMEALSNLGGLEDNELRSLIEKLSDEELKVSFRRRILHGQIDILRGELVNRLRKQSASS